MQNNFDLIKAHLKFEDPDDFYFVQIIKRRKDNPGMNGDTAVIKSYYVDSLEYLERKQESMIEYAEKHNARITIRLARRSYKKTALKAAVDMMQKIDTEQYKATKNSFDSAAGKYRSGKDKMWIIDVDSDEIKKYLYQDIIAVIDDAEPIKEQSKHILTVPSKTGFHFIVEPFDMREFKKLFPEIEIKKDNPTNLYIP